jgi:hypothetical protein
MNWSQKVDLPQGDELTAEQRLREVRERVKAARGALSKHPEAQEALRADRRREAAFLARFGITPAQLRGGITPSSESGPDGFTQILRAPCDGLREWQTRSPATFPG